MKKNIIPAILFFAVLTVSVKLSAANRPADEQDKVIDKVQYRIIYQTKSVSDTASRDSTGAYQYDTDEMRLDIGTKISRFYSYTNEHYDSLLDKYAERGDVQVLPDSETGSLQWVIYKNFPDGKTQVLDNVFIDEFKIIEPTQQPEWQMVEGAYQPKWEVIADSVVTILGYKCQMARTRFKGREWWAWFAEDIPLDNGPWKLCGLPGLILRAFDSEQQYMFEAVGLQQLKGTADIVYKAKYEKYEPISMKQFVELRSKVTPMDAFSAKGIKISVDTSAADVDKNELMQHLNGRTPYNPIEIVE